MTILELMKADHVDSQDDHFSEAALKAVAKSYQDNPSLHRFVTMGFSPAAKSIPGVANITYSCGALLITLEDEAEKLVKAEGLVPAVDGYMKVVKERDGVRYYSDFTLDRVAFVKPEDKVK